MGVKEKYKETEGERWGWKEYAYIVMVITEQTPIDAQ
jgi:hypothetical protein